MRTFGGTVDKTNRSVRDLTDSFERMGNKASSPRQMLRDYVLILGNLRLAMLNVRDIAVGWVASLMKQAGELERVTMLMRGLSTSTTEFGKNQEAKKNLSELMDMARSTGFELGALTDSFVKFKSAGLDTKQYSLKGLVDATAAFGGNSDVLKRASIAIQQMAGKGVISMEELRQQLGEAVPSAMKIMALAANKTMAQFAKEVATGTVQAKPHLQAMLRDMELMYAGSGARLANTLFGQLAQMKTNMMELSADFSSLGNKEGGLFATSVSSLKQFNQMLRSGEAKQFIADLGNGVASVISWLSQAAKFTFEWRNEIGALAKGMVAIAAAMAVSNTSQWLMGVVSSAKQASSAFATTMGQMRTASGSFVDAIRGRGTDLTTAWGRELSAVEQNIAASRVAVATAREEAVVKMQAVGTARAAEASARIAAATKAQEAAAALANVRAIEAERIAIISEITAQRQRVVAAQSGIMFAQRNIDLLGSNKARTDALRFAKTQLMMEEAKLTALQADQAAMQGRLATATTTATAAQNASTTAKRAAVLAARDVTAADYAATTSVTALATAEVGATVTTGQLTTALRVKAAASAAATAAGQILRGALVLLSNPLTMIAGGLLYAAYAAGVFSDKAELAAASADKLRKKIGDLNDAKKVGVAINALGSKLDDLYKKRANAQARFGATEAIDREIKETQAKMDSLKGALSTGMEGVMSRAGDSRYNDAIRSRMELIKADLAARTNATIQKENLEERALNGDKAAGLRRQQLLQTQANKELAIQQNFVDRIQNGWNAAKARGDKGQMSFFAGMLKPANEELTRLKTGMTASAEAAAAMGAKGSEGLGKMERAAVTADGKVAQLTARMHGANGAVEKFQAELAGGKYAGATEDQIGRMRRAAVAADALAATRKAAAADNGYNSMLQQMTGQLAQLEDTLDGGKGTLAKFNAQLAASSDQLGLTADQIARLRDLAQHIDEAKKDMDFKRLTDGLADDLAKAKAEADQLWTSFNNGTMEADQRLAQIKGRFADKLVGLSGPELEEAKHKIDEIVAAMQRADAAETTDRWRDQAEQIRTSLLSEDEAREANYQRELARQQSLLDAIRTNSAMTAMEKQRAEEQFLNWKRAAEARNARESEGAIARQARQWANLSTNMREVMADSLRTMVDAMFSANASLDDIVKDMIKSILKVILQAMIAYAILSAIGMANNAAGEPVSLGSFMKGQLGGGLTGSTSGSIGYGASGAAAPIYSGSADISSLSSGIGAITAPVGTNHKGGLMGRGDVANVAASLFTGAKTYHGGGWIGGRQLRSGEVPIVGLEDELVLTETQQRLLGDQLNQPGGQLPNVHVNIINNSGTELDAEQGEPQFNGKDMIVDVVVEGIQRQGRLREAIMGVKNG
jgi:tape measure domain-containing protein